LQYVSFMMSISKLKNIGKSPSCNKTLSQSETNLVPKAT
jgi:hypothetical protein